MLSSSQPSCSAPSAGPCSGSTSSSSNMRCLRKIAGIRWQDRVSNTHVLEMCVISGIEAFLLQSQFRWVGHVVRMPDFRILKQAFFVQLASGCQLQGGPVRPYKDSLKINLRACDLAPSVLRTVNHAAMHKSFNRIRQVEPMCTQFNRTYMVLWTRIIRKSLLQSSISIGSSIFAAALTACPATQMNRPLSVRLCDYVATRCT